MLHTSSPFTRVRPGLLAIALVLLSGCAALGLVDNATHFAYMVENAATALRASPAQEAIIKYQPLGNFHEDYAIDIKQSKREVKVDMFGNISGPGGGYLVVTGRHRGGTNYYERFVFVPQDISIRKAGAPTEIVLRKAGDRIDLVELR
ncbi:MAG: hypothetical protein JNN20_10310 [Betaproteobacteria bacterium]|nr:hypothetical protein [Betaproteobacteria bacterium]